VVATTKEVSTAPYHVVLPLIVIDALIMFADSPGYRKYNAETDKFRKALSVNLPKTRFLTSSLLHAISVFSCYAFS
jgi:hypothetical protein